MLRKEINLFFNALMFYTRIPFPFRVEYSEEILRKAFRYFPLVGILVGALGAGCYWGASQLFSNWISVLLAIIVMTLATGGIHEDGLADFFDGFGGGRTKARILEIMKDSSIGVYGVQAITLSLLLRLGLLHELPRADFPWILMGAHAFSRLLPILLVNSSQYVREENSKAAHTRSKVDLISVGIALVFAVAPLAFLPPLYLLGLFGVQVAIFVLLRSYVHRKIGGFTGDILGALQQFSEIGFYLTYLALIQLIA